MGPNFPKEIFCRWMLVLPVKYARVGVGYADILVVSVHLMPIRRKPIGPKSLPYEATSRLEEAYKECLIPS